MASMRAQNASTSWTWRGEAFGPVALISLLDRER